MHPRHLRLLAAALGMAVVCTPAAADLGWHGAQPSCRAPDDSHQAAVDQLAARLLDNRLFTSLAHALGPALACDAEVSADGQMSRLRYTWRAQAFEAAGADGERVWLQPAGGDLERQGASFEALAMPPEISRWRAHDPSGLPATMEGALREQAAAIGLRIDWDSPRPVAGAAGEQREYADPDPGLNGLAAVTKDAAGRTVALSLSLAP